LQPALACRHLEHPRGRRPAVASSRCKAATSPFLVSGLLLPCRWGPAGAAASPYDALCAQGSGTGIALTLASGSGSGSELASAPASVSASAPRSAALSASASTSASASASALSSSLAMHLVERAGACRGMITSWEKSSVDVRPSPNLHLHVESVVVKYNFTLPPKGSRAKNLELEGNDWKGGE